MFFVKYTLSKNQTGLILSKVTVVIFTTTFFVTYFMANFPSQEHALSNKFNQLYIGAPVAQWVKRWPTDLADRVRSSLKVESSQP